MPYTVDAYSNRLQNIGIKYVESTSAPDSTDYQFPRGTFWLETTTGHFYQLSDNSTNDAVWQDMSEALFGDAQESVLAIADCTATPPTENTGDRYILDETVGSVNAAWDGASKKDIVEFNGTSWQAYTPNKGWLTYVEDVNLLYVYTTAWSALGVAVAQATESTRGTAELATAAETIAYTNDTNIVTPLKLGSAFASPPAIGTGTPANGTFSTAYATTFDTNVAAAGVTLSGTSLTTDGTDGNITLTLAGKGTGGVNASNLFGIGETTPVTQAEMTGTAPYFTIHNSTEEDSDGGREGKIIFRGEQSGGEESVLGEIEFSHDGTGDDEKGVFFLRVNDGNDSTSPTQRMKVASDGTMTYSGSVLFDKTDGFFNMYDSAADSYPMIQLWHNAHDDIYMYFDSYYSGGNKSSDAGSNFRLSKYSDVFSIQYSSGNAQGAAVSFSSALAVGTSGIVNIGALGINTATVPHGGVGHCKVAIDGTNASATAAPAVQFTTDSDDYPLILVHPYTHDNIAMYWDAYQSSGTDKSSDAGSNFQLWKYNDQFNIRCQNGVTAGNTISSWKKAVVVEKTGEITMPAQPAVLAYNSATDTNQTGNGSPATVDFDTEVYDQGGDFATDTFTAPVTGRYRFDVAVTAGAVTNGTKAILTLVTTNRSYILDRINAHVCQDSDGYVTLRGSVLADMDATETATVTLTITGIGADSASIIGGGSPYDTFISVNLEC